ncbi:cytochrome c biogenesis protein ResB [Falsibacillus pallidus]|uniref:Cytochrome c biogenesis protein n=1 Tax=Falsibacillus pallidus TaxID=493781 RepID=A0A370GC41_9BACI|nr:cytochrome c biogenesis protein ResB [Falsibacillus pallidus]RDI41291.1 cytochrome c biogenesis protein [Falsibacillus pallidus]
MKDIKCECGHVNPHGTVLCEACGRALTEEAKNDRLHDMRYEGSARRSQVYNKTIIDKIWNFFSSVKVGVWLIVVTLIASALGTIFPQQMYIPPTVDPADYYKDTYGWLGDAYYTLGFNNLYSSWWYLILIASIGISLVICSLDRVIPLYKALKKQRVTRHEGFLKRQRVFGISEVSNLEEDMKTAAGKLKEKRYSIREENGNILAEKGRFSRWGPYINHIGLIIFLIGAMLRFIPGMYVDKVVWIREGETKVLPGTHEKYYLKNKKFILQTYDKQNDSAVFDQAIDRVGTIAKNYQSNVELYKREDGEVPGETNLKKVKSKQIKVNQPLTFDKYAVYQVDFKMDEFQAMYFDLTSKETGDKFGNIKVDLFNPKDSYNLKNGYKIELMGYYPDFSGFSKEGEPQTKSPVPNNPAFLFNMISPEHPDGEVSFVAIKQNVEPFGKNEYKMSFAGIDTRNVSALSVKKDLTLWVIAIGGIIFMIGVIQGAYWNHRRIWLQRKGGKVLVSGHTNKNWFGLKKDIAYVLNETSIAEPVDQLQEKEIDKE